jgi:uncharacterized protein (TIGR02687 family)
MGVKTNELKRIQARLNQEFSKEGRKLIFWYDEGGKFLEIVNNLDIDAKIYKLQKDNTFATKVLLEIEDTESNYLIYADFEMPKHVDNHLADTILYSTVFKPDLLSLFMNEAGIDPKFRHVLEQYKKFFDAADRRQKFLDLHIDRFNSAQTIEVAIMSVICKCYTASYDEVVKTVLTDSLEKNQYLKEFNKYEILNTFWQHAQIHYGYFEDNPTLEKFVIALLITYTAHKLPVEVKAFEKHLCAKKGNVTTFISNFMNNVLCKELYDSLARRVAQSLNIEKVIGALETTELLSFDTFECVDRELIKRSIKMLLEASNLTDVKNFCIKKRQQHYGEDFKNEYECIINASKFLMALENYNIKESYGDIIKRYVDKDYLIDQYYRKFYFYYDKIEDISCFEDLKQNIENIYTNDYLRKSTTTWSKVLSYVINDYKIAKQKDFYRSYVDNQKDRVVVIISDAFRYECAKELSEKLKQETYEPAMEYMIGSIPSYTSLGMASLLPHKEMAYDNKYKITVDDLPCYDLSQRNKILVQYNSDSIAVNYDDIMRKKRADLRDMFIGKKVIYIYHNQIDARGDKPSSENEVFNACEEAIQEIAKLMRVLTRDISALNYIVTADHGFIYKRDKIEESDKVNIPPNSNIELNKRYILSDEFIQLEGSQTFSMNYLFGKDNNSYVAVPVGSDIFKAKGGGQNFVHGGASLQEILLPVLKVHTHKATVEPNKVDLSLLNLMSGKIINLITNLDFIQTQPVSEDFVAATYSIHFEDAMGERITNTEQIVADKKSKEPVNRVFKRCFRFREKKYSPVEKYYLLIVDQATNATVIKKEVIIDIAFADEFNFGLEE